MAAPSEAWLEQALEIYKGNAVLLSELRAPIEALLAPPSVSPATLEAAKTFASPLAGPKALLERLTEWPQDEESFKTAIKEAQKASGVKGKDFFMPLRLALTGSEHGPELPKMLLLLGPVNTAARLQAFIHAL